MQCYYSTTDISAISVLNPISQELFLVTTIDPSISQGMSLAEFQTKQVKTYRDKGFSHKRRVSDNPEIIAANEKLSQKQKQKPPTKSRPAKPYEIQNHIDGLNNTAVPNVENILISEHNNNDVADYDPNDVSGHDES